MDQTVSEPGGRVHRDHLRPRITREMRLCWNRACKARHNVASGGEHSSRERLRTCIHTHLPNRDVHPRHVAVTIAPVSKKPSSFDPLAEPPSNALLIVAFKILQQFILLSRTEHAEHRTDLPVLLISRRRRPAHMSENDRTRTRSEHVHAVLMTTAFVDHPLMCSGGVPLGAASHRKPVYDARGRAQ
ncbi:hypothetical protein OH77DRAFT_43581 [Trametes cingulata]|nr:hypothetical protein OH77DRAFT_43581 [Trametes cingulata]